MEDQNKFGPISKLIQSAQSLIIILPPEPSQDQIISGLSLHLSLKESGKDSQIGCGSELSTDSKIFGLEEITDTIGSKNLVISFDYDENNLDKVDYDVRDDGKFYLLIKPKAGAPVPEASSVKFSYSGASADLVIVLGVNTLEELGKIYAEEKSFLDGANFLSINNSLKPISFTASSLVEPNSSLTEITANLIEKTELKASSQIATNLVNGIYEETSNLTTSKVTANTFSSLAFLMKSGAKLPNQQSTKYAQPPFFDAPESPVKLAQVHAGTDAEPIPLDWKQPKIFRAGDS